MVDGFTGPGAFKIRPHRHERPPGYEEGQAGPWDLDWTFYAAIW